MADIPIATTIDQAAASAAAAPIADTTASADAPVAPAVVDSSSSSSSATEAQSPGVPIYDISGSEPVFGHMHPDDVHDAIASGTYSFPKGSTVPAFAPDGTLGDLKAEEAPEAFKSGYTYATPDAIDNHDYSTIPQQAATVAEGLAQGIAGPLAPMAEEGLGLTTGEAIRKREKVNPWEHGLSEATGLVGGSLTGVGEGALLADAGEMAAKVLGSKSGTLMAKIGARSISDAAQMALYQGGNEVSKMIEGDPTQSVGSAAADVGLSGILGGAAGAALGTVSPLWSATVGDQAGKLLEDFKGRLNFLRQNPDMNEALTKELSDHYEGVKSAADEVYGANGIKAKGVSEAMPELHQGINDQAQGIASDLQQKIVKMQSDPYSYPPRLVNKLQGDMDAYLGKVTDPAADSNQIFNAGQDLKQQLQSYSKYDKFVTPVDEGYDFIKDAKGMAASVRQGLEDSDVWGKAGDLQKKINKAFTDYLPALKDFESKFTTKVSGEPQVDPAKINTYLNQLGKPNATVKQQMLQNFLDASEKYKNVISDVHAGLGSTSPIQPSGLTVANSTLNKVTPGMRLADYFVKQGVSHLAGEGLGTSVGAGIGHLVGMGQIGAIVGERALSPLFRSIFQSIAKPVMEGVSSSQGLKAAIDYTASVAKGDALLSKAAKSVFKSGTEVGVAGTEASRNKLDTQLKKLQADPSGLTQVGGAIGHYLPDHASSLAQNTTQAVNYLNSLRPNTTPALPLDSKLPANPTQKAAYNRALDIANNPLAVIDSIKKGTVTPQDVMTLNAVHPGAYQALSQKLTTEMMDHISKGNIIPYRTRMNLSMFLGKPLDSTMTPAGIQAAQPKPPMPQQATSTTPASGVKKSTSKLGGMAKDAMTTEQARANRAKKD